MDGNRQRAVVLAAEACGPELPSPHSFTRYSRDSSFSVIGRNLGFVAVMAAGSLVGTFIGGRLLGIVPSAVLLPLLAAILVLSAVKVWRHR